MEIKDIRIKLNMSQARFAKEYGIPLRTLQSWESGERKPAPYIIDLIIRVVNAEMKGNIKMKYIVFDDCGTDIYDEEFDTAAEAIDYADREFSRLTKSDLKRRNAFYVLESSNPDPEATDHWDGNIIKSYM